MKKIIRICTTITTIITLCLTVFLVYATVKEYNPNQFEQLDIATQVNKPENNENSWGILLWNVGYTGLGAEQDFVLDGGDSKQATVQETEQYRNSILQTITEYSNISNLIMLQEVDRDSKRSFYTDFYLTLQETLPTYDSAYATNYRSFFVPFPLTSPIGKVESGVATFSDLRITEATRIALPSKNSWPVRAFHLKRCLLVSRIPMGEQELVVINGHFSAYGPELLPEQLRITKEFILEEYHKGNYVVLGADWNQIPPIPKAKEYPLAEDPLYIPEEIPLDWTPEGWNWGIDPQAPTYRLLDKPYTASEFHQVGVIDGFLVSPNLEIVELKTLDLQFKDSDHNPVYIRVLAKE